MGLTSIYKNYILYVPRREVAATPGRAITGGTTAWESVITTGVQIGVGITIGIGIYGT